MLLPEKLKGCNRKCKEEWVVYSQNNTSGSVNEKENPSSRMDWLKESIWYAFTPLDCRVSSYG